MPYSLMPIKTKTNKIRCYEVRNSETGKVHSRCTSKKKADAQIRLLHSLEQSGAGWFGDLIKRITPTKRKEGVLPPQSRDLLAKIGSEPITSLTVVRTPLDSFVKTLLGVVSLGQFNTAVKQSSYDEMYHLTLFINNKYSWEKLEVVRLQQTNPIKAKSETLSIPAPSNTTIQQMVDKTRESMGDSDFSNYDPFNNNCQAFLIATLRAINVLTPQAETFIAQDAQKVLQKLPPWTGKISKFITDIGAVSSKIIEGENIKDEKINPKIKMKKRQEQEIEGGFLPALALALAPMLLGKVLGNGMGMHGGAIQQQEIEGGFLPALALALAPTLLGKLLGNGMMHGGAMPTLSAENIKMLISELQKMLPKTIEAVVEEMPQVALRGVREVKKAITGSGVRKTNSWTSALKEWNAGKPKYKIPKKGTKDYDEVRKLMMK